MVKVTGEGKGLKGQSMVASREVGWFLCEHERNFCKNNKVKNKHLLPSYDAVGRIS
jgi:hypothetical protein